MSLGAQPRSVISPLRPRVSQRPPRLAISRPRHALPAAGLLGSGLGLPAAVLAPALPLDGLAASIPDSTDPIYRPVLLPATSRFARFMFWHRTLGHPSLSVMRWYLRTYRQLDFGKLPSSLSCVVCDEGKSHRAAMLPERAGPDPLIAASGDYASVDIKETMTPGCDDIRYTAIIVSQRTQFKWALHAATKDLFCSTNP